jgi:hypothetical protein
VAAYRAIGAEYKIEGLRNNWINRGLVEQRRVKFMRHYAAHSRNRMSNAAKIAPLSIAGLRIPITRG